ncbi:MAG: helix-turn-helix domain-containing protein [Paracoccaceae bacterium]|nr:helix-turn-helix domain-containing protein [Paracoccaceae bacterium]MDE2913701.1 helix-turn-helix domain-containing protein [Paracoccaceae bacterium]
MTPVLITDTASLGAALRKARKSLKITQYKLSLQTGISRPTIRSIEQGKATTQVGLVLQLCQDLGLAVEVKFPEDVSRS